MKLHDLKPDVGAHKRKRRVGRGISAGQGKTAGRGTKGQKARPGKPKSPYFEGGQLPLVRRLPFKRGFTNLFRIEYQEVNVSALQTAFPKGGKIAAAELKAAHLISDVEKPIAILGDGDLKAKLTVSAHRFTKSARAKIEEAGGSVDELKLAVTGARATIKLLRKEDRAKLESKS
jgi:large subunit ribosomal protein L15